MTDKSAVRVHFDRWSVEIPKGWEHAIDDIVLLMRDPSSEGVLQMAALSKAENDKATDDDLKVFMTQMGLANAAASPARYGAFTGLHVRAENGKSAPQKHWFLRSDDTILVITYVCEEFVHDNDSGAVAATLNSLRGRENRAMH